MNNKDNNSGCGCLFFLLIFLTAFIIDKCKGNDDTEEHAQTSQSVSYYHPSQTNEESEEIPEEERQYLTNSLKTGDTPYTDFYGANYVCRQNQCSAIEVTAPENSDIVVIIKRNDENGAVISHGYIQAGCKYAFDLPNGTFQPFFYYGEGWNPNKEMGNGVRGGFVMYESFSKDNPQVIRDCVLSYVLQLKRDGNFQTQGSNRGEIF